MIALVYSTGSALCDPSAPSKSATRIRAKIVLFNIPGYNIYTPTAWEYYWMQIVQKYFDCDILRAIHRTPKHTQTHVNFLLVGTRKKYCFLYGLKIVRKHIFIQNTQNIQFFQNFQMHGISYQTYPSAWYIIPLTHTLSYLLLRISNYEIIIRCVFNFDLTSCVTK